MLVFGHGVVTEDHQLVARGTVSVHGIASLDGIFPDEFVPNKIDNKFNVLRMPIRLKYLKIKLHLHLNKRRYSSSYTNGARAMEHHVVKTHGERIPCL